MRMGPVEVMVLFNLHRKNQQMQQFRASTTPISVIGNCMFMLIFCITFVLCSLIFATYFNIYNLSYPGMLPPSLRKENNLPIMMIAILTYI
jgi:hypothetical protein